MITIQRLILAALVDSASSLASNYPSSGPVEFRSSCSPPGCIERRYLERCERQLRKNTLGEKKGSVSKALKLGNDYNDDDDDNDVDDDHSNDESTSCQKKRTLGRKKFH